MGGVPTVRGGVGDVHGKGHRPGPLVFSGLSIGDHRKQIGLPPGDRGGIAGKGQPGDAGDAVKVGRLTGPGFHPMPGSVGGHIGQERLVKHRKGLVVFRPKVGKGVVILVKHGVVGMHPVIGSRLALTVHAHPKGGVGEDCMGHAPDETGVKFQPLPLQHGPKPGHIQLHRHGVAAGQLVAVIMKVFPAGPGGQINGGKLHRDSTFLFLRVVGRPPLPGGLALPFVPEGCRTDFADIQNKKECGGNRQWQRRFLRNWAANMSGKEII